MTQLIDAMMAHPILINRPIVITPKGVKLCRPSETVLDILPTPQRGPFAKEDGEAVIDPRRQSHSEAHIMSDTARPPAGLRRQSPLWAFSNASSPSGWRSASSSASRSGQMIPGFFHMLGEATVAQVNIPVAVLVWLMIIPMLLKIDLAALGQVGQHWRGIAATVGVNWLVKAVLDGAARPGSSSPICSGPGCPRIRSTSYTAGLILLAAAPCTAMVFVWSNLVDGEPHFTLTQVALNDTIMVVAFAPIVALLLGLSSITVPWDTLILSVVLYIVVPVIVAQLWRAALLRQGGEASLSRTLRRSGAAFALRAAADARAAVRPARRTDHAPAARDRCCSRCRS